MGIGASENIEPVEFCDGDPPPGGSPEWPPEGASVAIDFKGGRYWSSGAEKVLTDLVGDDALFSITFNPADVVAGVGLTGSAALIGDALAALNADCAFIVTGINADVGHNVRFEFTEDSFTCDMHFRLTTSGTTPSLSDDGASSEGLALRLPSEAFLSPGAFKGGFSLSATVARAAINGTTLVNPATPSIKAFDPDTSVPFTTAICPWSDGIVETITIYPTTKSEAELQALTA